MKKKTTKRGSGKTAKKQRKSKGAKLPFASSVQGLSARWERWGDRFYYHWLPLALKLFAGILLAGLLGGMILGWDRAMSQRWAGAAIAGLFVLLVVFFVGAMLAALPSFFRWLWRQHWLTSLGALGLVGCFIALLLLLFFDARAADDPRQPLYPLPITGGKTDQTVGYVLQALMCCLVAWALGLLWIGRRERPR